MSIALKPYATYKDSGVEWLGEVPEGWGVCRIGWLYQRNKITNHENEQLLSVYRDYGVILKSSRNDNFNKPSDDLSSYQLVRAGDLVMNKMKAWQGSIAISSIQGIVSPAYYVCQPTEHMYRKKINDSFINFLVRIPLYASIYENKSKGIRINQWDLEYDEFKTIPILIPPLPEQQAIADYLDTQTQRIDSLVQEQKELIELLKEKRQALISHCVTKGLDPHAKMKDSGVEWMGEVPEGWEVKSLKYLTTCNDEVLGDNTNKELEIEYIEISDVNLSSGITNSSTMKFSEAPSRARRIIKKGDVIVSTVRTYLRSITAINFDTNNHVVSTGFAVIRPISIASEFLKYVFNAEFLISKIIAYSVGVSYPAINSSEIVKLEIPLPPLPEQQAIAEYLDSETTKIDSLIQEAEETITLMQEHRTALISAVVTGKVKVPGVIEQQTGG